MGKMLSSSSLIIRGQAGPLLIPIVAIPGLAIGAFTYFRSRLPEFCDRNGLMVLFIASTVSVILMVVALFLRARQVRVESDRLEYRSWLTNRAITLDRITAVSFEIEVSGGTDHLQTTAYLTFWADNESFVRFNPMFWPAEGLRALLETLRERAPQARFDRAVEVFLGPSRKKRA